MSLLSDLIPATTPFPPGFAEACDAIDAAPYGWPALAGEAAQIKCRLRGVSISAGAGLAGSGQLAGKTLTDPFEIVAIGDELRIAGHGAPPDAASKARVGGKGPDLPALLPPDAPEPTAPVVVAAEESPTKKTRKPRSDIGKPRTKENTLTTATEIGAALGAEILTVDVASLAPTPDHSPFRLFVDCSPNTKAVSLWPQVMAWHEALVDAANKGQPPEHRVSDARCASGQHPLAFGRWRGMLAALIAEQDLPGGDYTLDTRGSELGEVAAEALQGRADLYVRGWK